MLENIFKLLIRVHFSNITPFVALKSEVDSVSDYTGLMFGPCSDFELHSYVGIVNDKANLSNLATLKLIFIFILNPFVLPDYHKVEFF